METNSFSEAHARRRQTSRSRIAGSLALLILAAGCAGPALHLPGSNQRGNPEALKKSLPDNPTYRLQPGDALAFKFFYNNELNDDQVIRPDGKITLQLLNDIDAAGKTPEDLAADIKLRYRGILRQPEVSVMVKQVAPQTVYVGGEVREPKMLVVEGPATALQVIFQSGGLLPTASLNDVMLIRRSPAGRAEVFALDLSQPFNDVYLTNRDVVFVARSNIASMNLFVEQYIDRLIPISRSFGFSYVSEIFIP